MDSNQAINILIQSARISQSKGVFALEDAALIATAVKILTQDTEEKEVGGNEDDDNDTED